MSRSSSPASASSHGPADPNSLTPYPIPVFENESIKTMVHRCWECQDNRADVEGDLNDGLAEYEKRRDALVVAMNVMQGSARSYGNEADDASQLMSYEFAEEIQAKLDGEERLFKRWEAQLIKRSRMWDDWAKKWLMRASRRLAEMAEEYILELLRNEDVVDEGELDMFVPAIVPHTGEKRHRDDSEDLDEEERPRKRVYRS